jgi:hypothetical protein
MPDLSYYIKEKGWSLALFETDNDYVAHIGDMFERFWSNYVHTKFKTDNILDLRINYEQ